jgi:hypothetical protein
LTRRGRDGHHDLNQGTGARRQHRRHPRPRIVVRDDYAIPIEPVVAHVDRVSLGGAPCDIAEIGHREAERDLARGRHFEHGAARSVHRYERPHGRSRDRPLGQRNGIARSAGEVERHVAARRQDPHELAEVGGRVPRLDVLEHSAGVDDIERCVGPAREVRAIVHLVGTPLAVTVVRARQRDHGRRDVEAERCLEVIGQGLRDSTCAAAEVQRSLPRARDAQPGRVRHQVGHLDAAGLEELVHRPLTAAAGRVTENGPEGILAPERIPVPLQLDEVHRRIVALRTRQ